MSGPLAEISLLVGAYLIGSFPYVLLLSRAKGIKIEREEDYHLALWTKVGRVEGASGILVDIIKGILVVLIGFLLDFSLVIIVCAGVAAVIGQMWPVFQNFNGGKGNTTGGGMILALAIFLGNNALLVLYGSIAFFLMGFLMRTIPRLLAKRQTMHKKLVLGGPSSNSMPLCMLAAFIVMPLISWLANQPQVMSLGLTAMFIAIVIRRLTANIDIDLRSPKTSFGKILLNRLLFDRSYFQDQN